MTTNRTADEIDLALLSGLAKRPLATAVALAESTRISRNTVSARLARWEQDGTLASFERRINPRVLGYGLSAYIQTNVTQRKLAQVADALDHIPEVLEVSGLSGGADLLIRVVAVDADDLYRVAGHILTIDGVKRTSTSLVMRELVKYRIEPLLAARSSRLLTRSRQASVSASDTAP